MPNIITTDANVVRIISPRDKFPGKSDEEIIELLRQKLLRRLRGYKIAFVRRADGTSSYFDREERYHKIEDPEANKCRYAWQRYEITDGIAEIYKTVWAKASKNFVDGATMRDCLAVYLQETVVRRTVAYSEIERVVQKIDRPIYEREPGNQNRNTFDRIRVSVCLCSYLPWDELRGRIREWKTEITRMVMQRIENDNRFQRFGVPINFLHLSSLTMTRDFTLEVIFELKQITKIKGEKI